ncbi:MAG: CHAD domain-containing protein, partial [Ilumatobacteraceae bacterium]
MTMTAVREVEWKFEPVDETAQIPGAGEMGEIGMTLGPPIVIDLLATYYDTVDLRLLAHKLTLRHRTGGSDAGWHLKIPAGGAARTEVQVAGDAEGGVPAELLTLARSRVRRAPLDAVATLATRRVERTVCRADGTQVASMVDDHVHAHRSADDVVSDWHELEVELVGEATVDVLGEVAGVLVAFGWQRSTSPSKIGKVLGPPPTQPTTPHRGAMRCMLDHLAAHVDAIAVGDPLVRAGDADAVHDMRVAARRLRSALATFRPFFD